MDLRCGRSTWSLKMRRSGRNLLGLIWSGICPRAAFMPLMDIAMGHQTAADDAKALFTPGCSILPGLPRPTQAHLVGDPRFTLRVFLRGGSVWARFRTPLERGCGRPVPATVSARLSAQRASLPRNPLVRRSRYIFRQGMSSRACAASALSLGLNAYISGARRSLKNSVAPPPRLKKHELVNTIAAHRVS